MDTETFVRITEASLQMGFGALIAALSTWFMMRTMNQRVTRENRRMQILEDVASQVAHLTHTFAKYSTLVQESLQHGERWLPSRKQELETISNELMAEFKQMADAQAKLLMLGEKNLELGLRVYSARMTAYTRQVFVGRKDLSPEQVTTLKQGINQARELFYELLSRKYDRLLANA